MSRGQYWTLFERKASILLRCGWCGLGTSDLG
jgi:hypothetical protein